MKFEIKNHPAVRLGKFLKECRIEANLTLRDAAARMGIEASKLSEVERGIGNHMTEEFYDTLCHAYDIDHSYYGKGGYLNDLYVELAESPTLAISDIYDEEDVLPALIPLTSEEREKWLKVIGLKK